MATLETYLELCQLSSPSGKEDDMLVYLKAYLRRKKIHFKSDGIGNIYAIKGNSKTYPCIVAHVDEVHVKNKNKIVVQTKNLVYAMDPLKRAQTGIGADDKNGIWIALDMLDKLPACKVAFFVAEEAGCIGSKKANMKFFNDCRFVLQCDRKGNSNFINEVYFLELCSSNFVKACNIAEYGYNTCTGFMTDVYQLKLNGLAVSAANLSCGYYNPHTANEITDLDDMMNCRDLVENICRALTKTYPHEDSDPYEEDWENWARDKYYSKGGKTAKPLVYSGAVSIPPAATAAYKVKEQDNKEIIDDKTPKKD